MRNHEVVASTESTVARFIVWLARQRPAADERRYCAERVERFLRWQCQQRDRGSDHSEEAYYAQLSQSGAGDIQVNEARASIERLRQYLRAADTD
jgi:hypothetical protein